MNRRIASNVIKVEGDGEALGWYARLAKFAMLVKRRRNASNHVSEAMTPWLVAMLLVRTKMLAVERSPLSAASRCEDEGRRPVPCGRPTLRLDAAGAMMR